jgi:hypothetical protein
MPYRRLPLESFVSPRKTAGMPRLGRQAARHDVARAPVPHLVSYAAESCRGMNSLIQSPGIAHRR